MAKKSVVVRNEKRKETVARYAALREELKKKAWQAMPTPHANFESCHATVRQRVCAIGAI
jgi:SSU ribosomal protein S14P